MYSDFIKWAKENNKIKSVEEAFKEFPSEKEEHNKKENNYKLDNEIYTINECQLKYGEYNVGDIVFVYDFKYPSKTSENNHMFVIIDENKWIVPFEYFGLLISSNLEKLKYKQNVLLKKDDNNKLHKNSHVKTDYIYLLTEDMIAYKMGKVSQEQVEYFKECVKINSLPIVDKDEYIKNSQTLMDKEYELLEEMSRLRKEKQLSQRELAQILGMKQPTLAKIEKGKNSPQLNTILNILDSLGYTIKIEEKYKNRRKIK